MLDEIYERLEGAKRYENYVAGICPFHADNKPSLLVYEDYFYCLACGKRGKPEYLLKQLNVPRFVKVKMTEEYKNPWSEWLKNKSPLEVCKLAFRNGQSTYLEKRCIPIQIQKKLKIGTLDNWVIFPFFDKRNNLIGAVARAGEGNSFPSRYIVPANQNPNLLYIPKWDILNEYNHCYCVFGIIDAVSLYTLGVPAMSTAMGKKINSSAFDGIRKRIFFIPDNLEEGDAQRIASKLDWRGTVLNIKYPEDCKDINDLHRKGLLKRKDFKIND